MNLPNFCMELLWILTLSGEPIILCLVNYLAAAERPQHCALVHFTINHIIGSPDVFRLRKEPIHSRLYVRALVRPGVPVLQPWLFDIFFYFLHEVVSPYDLDDHQKIFRSKNFLTPKMAKNGQNLAIFGQYSHFWVFLAYIFQTPL